MLEGGKLAESPKAVEAEVSDGAQSPRSPHKVGLQSAGPHVPTAEPPGAHVSPDDTTPASNEDPDPKRYLNNFTEPNKVKS